MCWDTGTPRPASGTLLRRMYIPLVLGTVTHSVDVYSHHWCNLVPFYQNPISQGSGNDVVCSLGTPETQKLPARHVSNPHKSGKDLIGVALSMQADSGISVSFMAARTLLSTWSAPGGCFLCIKGPESIGGGYWEAQYCALNTQSQLGQIEQFPILNNGWNSPKKRRCHVFW